MDRVRCRAGKSRGREAETKVTDDNERCLLKVPHVPQFHWINFTFEMRFNMNPLHSFVSDCKKHSTVSAII